MAEKKATEIERDVKQLGPRPEELKLEDAPVSMKRRTRTIETEVKPGTREPVAVAVPEKAKAQH
jgi:hypothetical protein